MDLPRGLIQSGSTHREDRKEGEEGLQLLDPDVYSGDAEVDLISRLCRPLVDPPELVADPPPRLALGDDPKSDLITHQYERHAEIPASGQKPLELGERRLVPRRDPQGE